MKRDFAEAERILAQIKERISTPPWNKGYILALEGMLTANRAKDDQYSFFNRLQSEKSNLSKWMELLKARAQNWMSPDFDRGFFTAWTDFIEFLNRTKFLDSINSLKRSKLSNRDNSKVYGESVE